MADIPPNTDPPDTPDPSAGPGAPRSNPDVENKPADPPLHLRLNLPAGTQLDLSITDIPGMDQPRQEHRITVEPENLTQRWRIDAEGVHPRKHVLHGIHSTWLAIQRTANRGLQHLSEHSTPFSTGLFLAALLVYLATRFFHLSNYPIYFFTDEAIHTVLAADFLRDGLRDYSGILLPTYFKNAALYNLSASVYLQLIPTLLFGKSVFVTRAVSVLVAASGAAAVALTLKDTFRLRDWWSGILILGIAPAWFLHSRTAFETVLMVSFYAWFLYFYSLYRHTSPRYLYAAVVFGALSFYSYSGGQLVLLATALALLFSDLRYHIQNRSIVGKALLLTGICALPYLRFQLTNPGETNFHLRMLQAYWLQNLPVQEKLSIFAQNYLRGLDPRYWFFSQEDDLPRHLMNGYGHILWPLLPFLILGLIRGLTHLKESMYRNLILITLAAPVGGAIVGIGITRDLVFLVAASIWIALGIGLVLERTRRESSGITLSLILFASLTSTSIWLTNAAITQGPTWETDYGMGGMQYGAAQIFRTAEEKITSGAYDLVYVSPTWANGTDILRRFFLPDNVPVFIGNAHGFLESYREELDQRLLFFLTASEYEALLESDKVTDISIDEIIPYPDSSPGFYLVQMRYVDGVEDIFAAEQALRLQPVTDEIFLDDLAFTFQHPRLDMGETQHMFDGDTYTMGRVDLGNPALFVFSFTRPEVLSGLTLTTGSMDYDLGVTITLEDESERHLDETFRGLPNDPTVSITFGETPLALTRIEIEIFNPIGGEAFKIHIRDISLVR